MHCGVCHRYPTIIVPFEGNETDVSVAHGGLAEEVNAVFCFRFSGYSMQV